MNESGDLKKGIQFLIHSLEASNKSNDTMAANYFHC
jgi:hypothetical protein